MEFEEMRRRGLLLLVLSTKIVDRVFYVVSGGEESDEV
jgi:hypothetical protein